MNTQKYLIPKDETNELVGQIIDIFEDFLTKRNLIPDNEERNKEIISEQDPHDIALIYGSDYDELDKKLTELLKNWNIIH